MGESIDEGGKGWNFDYDDKTKYSYIQNDDENSEQNKYYLL